MLLYGGWIETQKTIYHNQFLDLNKTFKKEEEEKYHVMQLKFVSQFFTIIEVTYTFINHLLLRDFKLKPVSPITFATNVLCFC